MVPLLTVVCGFLLILIRTYAIIPPFSTLLGRYQYQRYKIQTGVTGIWYPLTPGTASPVNRYPVVRNHRTGSKLSRWFSTPLFWYPGTNFGEGNGALILPVK